MSEIDTENNNYADKSKATGNWAQPVSSLKANVAEKKAPNRVDGKQLLGALQGFGPMWQKTYSMRLPGLNYSPAYVIQVWKENFPKFWPKGNRFYAPFSGIQPGEVALVKGSVPGGFKLSTGVMVIYTDEESFTFMTPQGHVFAGWVTFSATTEGKHTRVQVRVLMRSSDPIIELGTRMGGHAAENKFWLGTLENLSKYLGVETVAESEVICLDKKVQWREIRNLRYNAVIGSTLYSFMAPLRWLSERGKPHQIKD